MYERMYKKKRVAKDYDYEINLALTIYHAEGIDNPSDYPSLNERVYGVAFWVHPEDQYRTSMVYGQPDPTWNLTYQMGLDESSDCRFLYVEVVRFGSRSESNPGTSNGIALVGRAKIPLPKLLNKKDGRFGLVRLDGAGHKANGHIILSMELLKRYRDY